MLVQGKIQTLVTRSSIPVHGPLGFIFDPVNQRQIRQLLKCMSSYWAFESLKSHDLGVLKCVGAVF